MKKAVLGLLLVFVAGVVFGQQGYAYEVVDGRSVTIIGFIGNDATLDIPAQIQGMPVTTIDDTTWNNSNGRLTSIAIPSSVSFINERAFSFVDTLTSITVDSRNPYYTSVDGVLFDKNIQTIIAYPLGRTARTYTIPSTVTSIGNRAFNSSSLTSITIPPSITSIGEWAFSFTKLTSITIPSSVTFIGQRAFAATDLTSVSLSRHTQVEVAAFPDTARITYRD